MSIKLRDGCKRKSLDSAIETLFVTFHLFSLTFLLSCLSWSSNTNRYQELCLKFWLLFIDQLCSTLQSQIGPSQTNKCNESSTSLAMSCSFFFFFAIHSIIVRIYTSDFYISLIFLLYFFILGFRRCSVDLTFSWPNALAVPSNFIDNFHNMANLNVQ